MPEKNFAVSLTKCFYCNEDHQILLNSNLTKSAKEAIEHAHGKIIDMSACNNCEELMEKGIIVIGISYKDSAPDWQEDEMPNPFRTGQFLVVKKSVFEEDGAVRHFLNDFVVKNDVATSKFCESTLRCKWCFLDQSWLCAIGLIAEEQLYNTSR